MNKKLIYLISTSLITLLMLMSASMYFLKQDIVAETFTNLGYPTYLIYPLAVAKLLGLIAIWTRKNNTLREWAYAGFFFDFVLAAMAHFHVSDGQAAPALVGIVLLLVSYFSGKNE